MYEMPRTGYRRLNHGGKIITDIARHLQVTAVSCMYRVPCVGVLVICVLVFNVFCVICTVILYCLV